MHSQPITSVCLLPTGTFLPPPISSASLFHPLRWQLSFDSQSRRHSQTRRYQEVRSGSNFQVGGVGMGQSANVMISPCACHPCVTVPTCSLSPPPPRVSSDRPLIATGFTGTEQPSVPTVRCPAVSPLHVLPFVGQYIAAGSANGCVHVWNVSTAKEVAVLAGHKYLAPNPSAHFSSPLSLSMKLLHLCNPSFVCGAEGWWRPALGAPTTSSRAWTRIRNS